VAAGSYMFSAAMPPVTAAKIIAAIDLMEKDPTFRLKLWENTEHLKRGFNSLGFNTFSSETQIIPIFIGKDRKGIEFSRRLYDYGIYGPCVRWPAVTKNQSRIRFTVMASHTPEQIDYLLECCRSLGIQMRIIKADAQQHCSHFSVGRTRRDEETFRMKEDIAGKRDTTLVFKKTQNEHREQIMI
jgi:glycine C-acetyltransferase